MGWLLRTEHYRNIFSVSLWAKGEVKKEMSAAAGQAIANACPHKLMKPMAAPKLM
ncbi:hypothetical protein GCM10007414_37810 [Agarivorans gilvus]|jgi:hypothetical protein|uniref:Uncharacterized protein n=1 Tax=Agarivorans gilvus TaxID=680279 RepID=A0ABQ1I7H8_9ALTE|nr:hypothetical protein GCM10007414_37810 [Agarivorans gilvus]